MDLESLSAFPRFLASAAEFIPTTSWAVRPVDGNFALVEQAWHLADLEVEGFGLRIRRLLEEESPSLPDFDGAGIAARRNYRSLDLKEWLVKFAAARRVNVAALQKVSNEQWKRNGEQEGVGVVTLADIPLAMARHDAEHRGEIEALIAEMTRES
jgi:hypothetical protein